MAKAQALAVPGREPLLSREGDVARRWRVEFFDVLERQFGRWVPVEYAASFFDWTVQAVDQTTFAYCLMGKRLEIAIVLTGTVSGAVASVSLALPAGLAAARAMTAVLVVNDNGALVPGKARIAAGNTAFTITRLDDAAFTDLVGLEGTWSVEVE